MTRETLEMANCLLTLHLIHQTTQSAIMLLAADSTNGTVADAQVSQIKELLSASLSHFTDVPNFSNAEFRVFLQFCVNAAEQLGATRTTT